MKLKLILGLLLAIAFTTLVHAEQPATINSDKAVLSSGDLKLAPKDEYHPIDLYINHDNHF